MLEELLALGHGGAEYDAWLIRIDGNQFGSGFVAVNPNSKIPALMDRSGPTPIRVFESGAILMHLAEKFGAFLPTERGEHAPNACRGCSGRWAARLISAAALATSTPMRRAKIEYAIDRFAMEVKRQLDVLDRRLADSEYLAGSEYTIADIAVWPWYGSLAKGVLYGAGEFLDVHGLQERAALDRRDRQASGRASAGAWSTAPGATRRASCTSATRPVISIRDAGQDWRAGRRAAVARVGYKIKQGEGGDDGSDPTHHSDHGRRGHRHGCRTRAYSRNRPGGTAMGMFEKGAVRIHFEEAGSGFPLLVIAGGGLNSTIAGLAGASSPFNPIEEFKGEYRCIAADLRNANAGQSSGPLEIDRPWDSYTDDHLALMDHLGINKFMVHGLLHRRPLDLESAEARARPHRRRRAGAAERLAPRDARPVLRQQHEGLGSGAGQAPARHHDGARSINS